MVKTENNREISYILGCGYLHKLTRVCACRKTDSKRTRSRRKYTRTIIVAPVLQPATADG